GSGRGRIPLRPSALVAPGDAGVGGTPLRGPEPQTAGRGSWIPACAGMSGGEAVPRATAVVSLRADARFADRLRPALDLRRQKLREVFRRAALRRHDFEPELLEPAADGRIVDGLAHCL